MIGSNLPGGSSSQLDSLLSFIIDPKKSENAVKRLKAENDHNQKLKLELLKGKKIDQFCADKKKEADQEAQRLVEIKKEIKKEKDSFNRSMSTTKGKLQSKQNELDAKEKTLNEQEQLLRKRETELAKNLKQLEKREKESSVAMEQAQKLKQEYEFKLSDFKERMRGL